MNSFTESSFRNISFDTNNKRKNEEEYISINYNKIKIKIVLSSSNITPNLLKKYIQIWGKQSYKNYYLVLFLGDLLLNKSDIQEIIKICEYDNRLELIKCSVVDYIFDKSEIVFFQNFQSKYDDSFLYSIARSCAESNKEIFTWNTAYLVPDSGKSFFYRKPNMELYTLLEFDYINGSFAAFGDFINQVGLEINNSEVQLSKLIRNLALIYEDKFYNIPVFLEKRSSSIEVRKSLKRQSYVWNINPPSDVSLSSELNNGLSIIISFRDKPLETIGTLKSVCSQNFDHPLELILINNESNHHSLHELKAYLSSECTCKYKLIDYMEQFNHSKQCNIGVEASSHNNILLLNNDIIFDDLDCLNELYLHVNSKLFATVGVRVMSESGLLSSAGLRARSGGEIFDSPVESSVDQRFAYINRETLGNGFACVAIRKNLYQKLGGLDEINFPNGYNDVEFCLRAISNGNRHFYLGSVSITHATGTSRGKADEIFQKISLRMRYPYLQLRSFFQLESDKFYSR